MEASSYQLLTTEAPQQPLASNQSRLIMSGCFACFAGATIYQAWDELGLSLGEWTSWTVAVAAIVSVSRLELHRDYEDDKCWESAERFINTVFCTPGAMVPKWWKVSVDDLLGFFYWHPRLTFTVGVNGLVGLLNAVGRSAHKWEQHLFTDTEPAPNPQALNHTLADWVQSPSQLCMMFGSAPMPYFFFLGKSVWLSFLMDFVMGSHDLHASETTPQKISSIAFVAFQVTMWLLAFGRVAQLVWTHAMGGNSTHPVWAQYNVGIYLSCQASALAGLVTLACKMFAETNLDQGAPIEMCQVSKYRLPKLNHNLRCLELLRTKAAVFYTSIGLSAVVIIPACVTHIVEVCVVYGVIGLAFPIWGTLLMMTRVLFLCMHLPVTLLNDAIQLGASTHVELWGTVALLVLMMFFAMYFRAMLWLAQNRAKGISFTDNAEACINGRWGYAKSTMTICFATPAIFAIQSLSTWGALMYVGQPIEALPLRDFNSRQWRAYEHCLASTTVPLVDRMLSWFGLA